LEADWYVRQYRAILDALQKAGIYDGEVAAVILQEIGKDRRQMEVAERERNAAGEPATERQKKFLEKKGVLFPKNLTKLQASEVISRVMAQDRK